MALGQTDKTVLTGKLGEQTGMQILKGENLPHYTTALRPAAPPTGTVIYNTSDNKIQVYTGSGWEAVTSS